MNKFSEAKLINKETGLVIFKFTMDEGWNAESNISGKFKKNDGSDCDFMAEGYIKQDGCSHFRFYGEDYIVDGDNKIDPYYHICGAYHYIEFMRFLAFAYELMIINCGRISEEKGYKELKELNLLEGFIIETK